MGRDLEEAVWSSYCWGGISRGLFKAFILAEGYNKGVERSGEACSELLYRRRDVEEAVWSSYCCGGILRGLFKAFILVEGYNKGGESCSELL